MEPAIMPSYTGHTLPCVTRLHTIAEREVFGQRPVASLKRLAPIPRLALLGNAFVSTTDMPATWSRGYRSACPGTLKVRTLTIISGSLGQAIYRNCLQLSRVDTVVCLRIMLPTSSRWIGSTINRRSASTLTSSNGTAAMQSTVLRGINYIGTTLFMSSTWSKRLCGR